MDKFNRIIIETSAVCNLKCIMCPTLNYKEGFGIMESIIFDKIIDSIDKVEAISLDGWGEPLLDKKIFERVRKAKTKANNVGFSTNATLFNLDNIEEAKNSGIDIINISMDGGSKEVYEKIRVGSDFGKTMYNIELLSRKGLHITITMTLSKINCEDVINLILRMHDLGIRDLVIKPTDVVSSIKVNKLTLSKDQIARIYENAKNEIEKRGLNINLQTWDVFNYLKPEKNCLADPLQSVFIGYNGEVSPCCNLGHHVPRIHSIIKKSGDTFASYGNIMELNIYDIWFSDKYIKFRNEMAHNARPEICSLCRIY